MKASFNGSQIKNPVVRALFAIVGVLIAVGLIGLLVLVALPLAIGVAVVGGLAAVFIPRLRRRRPRSQPLPRQPGEMKSVEPDAPPRTLE